MDLGISTANFRYIFLNSSCQGFLQLISSDADDWTSFKCHDFNKT